MSSYTVDGRDMLERVYDRLLLDRQILNAYSDRVNWEAREIVVKLMAGVPRKEPR